MNNERYAVATRIPCSYSTYKQFWDKPYVPIKYPVKVSSDPSMLQTFTPHTFKTEYKQVNNNNGCGNYKNLGNT